MNYSSPLNPYTSEKSSRMEERASNDAAVLTAMRAKIEEHARKGLHEAEMIAIAELELLTPETTMAALREQLSGKQLHELITEGFYAARQTLWRVSGSDFPEPEMDVEEE